MSSPQPKAIPPPSATTKVSNGQLAVTMPVSVWVDGEDPAQALGGKTWLVGRDSVRVQVPQLFAPGTRLRVKTPLRSRSMVAIAGPGEELADRGMVMEILAAGIGAYLGVVFPAAGPMLKGTPEVTQMEKGPPEVAPEATMEVTVAGAEDPLAAKTEEPERAELVQAVPEAVSTQESPAAASTPLPLPFPEEVPTHRLDIVLSGIDCARAAFSQNANATLDASGSLRVQLRQLIDLGARLRLVMAGKEGRGGDRHWNCRVYSRSPYRAANGYWVYRLVFENVSELLRELEVLPRDRNRERSSTSHLLLAELNTLRSVVIALLYELHQHGMLKDETLLATLLHRKDPILDKERLE